MKIGNKPVGPPVNPNPDYQDRDIAIGALNKFLIATFAVVFLAMIAMWWLHKAVVDRERAAYSAVPEQMRDRQIAAATGTILQRDEQSDLRRYREEQAALPTSYGWVDKDKGVARIPVERAMALALEKKMFPVEKK